MLKKRLMMFCRSWYTDTNYNIFKKFGVKTLISKLQLVCCNTGFTGGKGTESTLQSAPGI